MPFQKGHKLGKGRPKGSINKKTERWNELGDFITEFGADKVKEILMGYADSLDPKDQEKFLEHYKGLLEYFQPKLQRTENKTELTLPTIVVKESDE